MRTHDPPREDTFSKDDVRKEFRHAGEAVPGNYSRDFRWAVSAGWIAPVLGEPDMFFVTGKGDKAVEAKFSEEIKKATGVGKTARRRRPRKKGDEE